MTDQIDQDADTRTQRALTAYLRQELSAPATAIMGYAEMLMNDAVRSGRAALTDDLERILDASRSLNGLILSLLDRAAIHQTDGISDLSEFRRTLRHDLRTPLNAIKGYGEMLREDVADASGETFAADLDKLLAEATLLLDRIDDLVTYTGADAAAFDEVTHSSTIIAARASMVDSLLKAVRPVGNEGELAPAKPGRILVVDDNASNRDVLSRRLQRQGHSVLQAEDGAIALALVEKEALDLILLDLMMPGINGYDLLTLLKRDPRFRDIPVIMISALSELDSIVRCIEAGADDYLAKPFDPTLLRARVGSSLEKKHMRDREREMIKALRIEKDRSEQLLLNILPQAIVARLSCDETLIADHLSDVTILFADLIGFTALSSQLSARDVVRLLNGLFSEFDQLALSFGVEKIKTVGDAYMLAGGVPEPRTDNAHAVADTALAMLETVKRTNYDLQIPLQMRFGMHSGDVVAGIIGTHKFVYDIWGDAVNIASRMELHGMPNRIQISAATRLRIHEHFQLELHGYVDIKGKGRMETFILLGRR